MNHITKLVALLCGAVAAAPADAQGRSLEQRLTYDLFTSYTAPDGTTGTVSSPNGEASNLIVTFREGPVTGATDAPFETPGGIDWLQQTAARRFLVCGTNGLSSTPPGTQGVLALVEITPESGIGVVGTSVLPGLDLLGVAWSADLASLFVVDGDSDSLLVAPWAGPSAPLPAASDFNPLFTASQLSTLGRPHVVLQDVSAGVRVLDQSVWRGHEATYDGSSWSLSVFDPRADTATPPRWYVEGYRAVDASEPFDLRLLGSSAGGAFQLVALFGADQYLVSGGYHSGTNPVPIVPPDVFSELPGWHFAITGSGYREVHLRPVVRYGSAINSAVLHVDQDLFLPAAWFHVGVDRFFAPRMVLHRPPSQPPASRDGWLLAEARSAGADPVVPLGNGGYTLSSPAVFPFTVSFEQDEELAHIRSRFDVPDQPGLETLVMFFQIVVDDGSGGLAYTLVGGTSVLPAAADPLLRFADTSSSIAGQRSGRSLSDYRERARRVRTDPEVRSVLEGWLEPHRDPELSGQLRRRMGGT